MAYSLSIQQILNTWAEQGVFSYLFPFLIIFAVVFAILQKTDLFAGRDKDGKSAKNVNGINAIIAVSVAFISLLNDYVSTFFATIFPKFGIALAIMLVLLIILGFVGKNGEADKVGWILGIGVIIWAWSEWDNMFGGGFEFTYFLDQYFWGIILLVGVGGLIYWIVKGDSAPKPPKTT
jgi:hypothetical protein